MARKLTKSTVKSLPESETKIIIDQYNYVTDKLGEVIDTIMQDPLQEKYQEYLAEYRNIDAGIIKEQKIFYVLDKSYFDGIMDNFDKDFLGFAYNGDNVFRERFIIPIKNAEGKFVGMAGYDYESDIKYLMAGTMFFDKTTHFFGYEDIDYCYNESTVVLVEGFFDRLRLKEVGIRNSLATMGTMLCDFHQQVIGRLDKTILIPDNDKSGKYAAKDWAGLLKGKTKLAIVEFKDKECKDIDDFILADKEENSERVRQLYARISEDMDSPFYLGVNTYLL